VIVPRTSTGARNPTEKKIMKSLIAALVLSIGFGTVAHAAGVYTQSNGTLPSWAAQAFEPNGK